MKVSKGQSQPYIVAAALVFPYMVLGQPFEYRVLIVTQVGVRKRNHLSFMFPFTRATHVLGLPI